MFKRRKLASNCTKRCNNLIRKKRAEWMNFNRDSPYNIINDFVESDTLNRETFTPQISNREIFTPQISNGEISALQISNRETFTSQINQLPGPNIINSSNQLLTSEAEILSHSDDSCNEFDNSLISNHSINSDWRLSYIRAWQTESCYDRLFFIIIHARSNSKKIKLAKHSYRFYNVRCNFFKNISE